MTTRRAFLRQSSVAALATTLRRPALAHVTTILRQEGTPRKGRVLGPRVPLADDPTVKELAAQALDSAKAAGATYADVRFTVTRRRTFEGLAYPNNEEVLAVGVRALANGAWAFAASPDWTSEMMRRLGRTAAEQAKGNAWPGVPPSELGAQPPAVGHWQTPIERNPFEVPAGEVADYQASLVKAGKQFQISLNAKLVFTRQERTFASTEGAFVTQSIYRGMDADFEGSSYLQVKLGDTSYLAPFISPHGGGYEVLERLRIQEQLLALCEQVKELRTAKPLPNPGKYDVVFDGYAMATIVNRTMGNALEFDRALGYEANNSGTSYLAPAERILGHPVAAPVVNITANRTTPGGAATVGWDDEGVAAQEFPLVERGVAVDYAGSREFVPALASWYRSRGRPVCSNGCLGSQDASNFALVQTPNLELRPGERDVTFDELVAGIDDGFAVMGGLVDLDQQLRSGMGQGRTVYAIKKGKLAGVVNGAAYLFRSPELWGDLAALGGASTAVMRGFSTSKGEPHQRHTNSVKAVAAHVKNVRIIRDK